MRQAQRKLDIRERRIFSEDLKKLNRSYEVYSAFFIVKFSFTYRSFAYPHICMLADLHIFNCQFSTIH
jgi:hypothetical protein